MEKPRIDLTLSEVIYPDENKTINENMGMFYQKKWISGWNVLN